MSRIKGALTRKLGPLPAWVWLTIAGGAILLYRRWSGGLGLGSLTGAGNTSQSAAGTVAVGTPVAGGGSGDGGAPPQADTTNAGQLSTADLGPGAPVVFDPQTGGYTLGSDTGTFPISSGQPGDISSSEGGSSGLITPDAIVSPPGIVLPKGGLQGIVDKLFAGAGGGPTGAGGGKNLKGGKPHHRRTKKGTGSTAKATHITKPKTGLSRPVTTTTTAPSRTAPRSGAHASRPRVNLTAAGSPKVAGVVHAPTAPAVRAGATRSRVPAKPATPSVVVRKTAPAAPVSHPSTVATIHPPAPPPPRRMATGGGRARPA